MNVKARGGDTFIPTIVKGAKMNKIITLKLFGSSTSIWHPKSIAKKS